MAAGMLLALFGARNLNLSGASDCAKRWERPAVLTWAGGCLLSEFWRRCARR